MNTAVCNCSAAQFEPCAAGEVGPVFFRGIPSRPPEYITGILDCPRTLSWWREDDEWVVQHGPNLEHHRRFDAAAFWLDQVQHPILPEHMHSPRTWRAIRDWLYELHRFERSGDIAGRAGV